MHLFTLWSGSSPLICTYAYVRVNNIWIPMYMDSHVLVANHSTIIVHIRSYGIITKQNLLAICPSYFHLERVSISANLKHRNIILDIGCCHCSISTAVITATLYNITTENTTISLQTLYLYILHQIVECQQCRVSLSHDLN